MARAGGAERGAGAGAKPSRLVCQLCLQGLSDIGKRQQKAARADPLVRWLFPSFATDRSMNSQSAGRRHWDSVTQKTAVTWVPWASVHCVGFPSISFARVKQISVRAGATCTKELDRRPVRGGRVVGRRSWGGRPMPPDLSS